MSLSEGTHTFPLALDFGHQASPAAQAYRVLWFAFQTQSGAYSSKPWVLAAGR